MTDGLFESLLHEEESSSLDFKRDQYPFVGASDDDKSELLKDILAFAANRPHGRLGRARVVPCGIICDGVDGPGRPIRRETCCYAVLTPGFCKMDECLRVVDASQKTRDDSALPKARRGLTCYLFPLYWKCEKDKRTRCARWACPGISAGHFSAAGRTGS